MEMKRRPGIIIIATFLILLLMVSCGSEEEDLSPDDRETKQVDLKVLYSQTGKTIMSYGGGNEDGYYNVIPRMWNLEEQINDNEIDGNIVYLDYATNTRVYLCQDPSCRHNTEDCTSFIKASSNIIVFPATDKLICFRFGIDAAASQDDLYAVILMDLNGRNKETLTLSASQSFALPLVVASDGEKIYFQVTESQKEADGIKTVKAIYSVDLNTKELNKVVDTPNQYCLFSAYDEFLVLFDYVNMENITYSVTDNTFESRIKGVSGLYNGNLSIDLKYDIDVGGDPVKVLEAKSITIIVTDIRDNSVKTYGPFDLEDDHGAGVSLNDCYDDHICIGYVINVSSEEPLQVFYTLDLATGEYTKNTLYITDNGETVPSSIIADAGDRYLVSYNSKDMTRTIFDRKGVSHTVEYKGCACYALISKEDFYSNTNVFSPTDDTIYE